MEKARVVLENDLKAEIEIRDFSLVADETLESGGTNEGPEPPELLLGAIGACAAITMRLYARRKGWDLQKVDIHLEVEKVDPALYPEKTAGAALAHVVRKRYYFTGDLTSEQKTRLIEIGTKCPVARIVQNPVIFEDHLIEEQA